jgi:hypothetical protein
VILPSATLTTRWVRVRAFPKAKRFGRYGLVLERCHAPQGEPHSILVAYVRDHRFLRDVLAALPHVPRAVKSIYRAEVRLAHSRATSGWHVWAAQDAAEAAWETYTRAAERRERVVGGEGA